MPRRNLTMIVTLLAFAALAFFLVLRGQNSWAEHDKMALARTAGEHVSTCARLGIAPGSNQHNGCLRELDSLKVLHDKWSSEDAQSFL